MLYSPRQIMRQRKILPGDKKIIFFFWVSSLLPVISLEWFIPYLMLLGIFILLELDYFKKIHSFSSKQNKIEQLDFEFEIHWPKYMESGRPKKIQIVWNKKIQDTQIQILMPKGFSPNVLTLTSVSEYFIVTGKKKGSHSNVEIYLIRFSRLRFFRICYKLYHNRKINVVPPILYLSQKNLSFRKESLFRYSGAESEFHSLRPYQTEDTFKHINWKKSALNPEELYVNLFEKERNRKVLIILNNGMLSNFEYKGIPYFDHQIALAFQLAFTFLKNQDHTGLLTFSDTIDIFIPPELTKTQISFIFNHLQKAQYGYGYIDLAHIYSFIKDKLPVQSILIVLSPFLSFQQILLQKKIFHLLGRSYQIILVNPLRFSGQTKKRLDLPYLWSRAHILNEEQDQMIFFKKNNLLYVKERPDKLYKEVIQNYSSLKW